MGKREQYEQLVVERKKCFACHPELLNPSEIRDGDFDSNRLGPYTCWQGNLNSDIVLIAQDFYPEQGFIRLKGWPGPDVKTNENLVQLFREIDREICLPQYGRPEDKVFFTNSVLCMQRGAAHGKLKEAHIRNCSTRFLRHIIELVSPRIVISVGRPAFRAASYAFNLPSSIRSRPLNQIVSKSVPLQLNNRTYLFPQFHCGGRGLASRSLRMQKADWRRINAWLNQ